MNIDLNQVFHLHNSVDRPITVVYKKLHLQNISEVNAVLKIDETDHVTEQRLFDGKDPDEVLQHVNRCLYCGHSLVD